MELEKMSNSELREIIHRINIEIQKRGEKYNRMMRINKTIRQHNYDTTKELLDFISEELGYNVLIKSRKIKYVMTRHALYLYFRNLDDYQRCSLLEYAKLLNCNHSTIIFNAKTAQNLKDSNNFDYLMAEDRLTQIISKFLILKQNQNEQKFAKSTQQVPATCETN